VNLRADELGAGSRCAADRQAARGALTDDEYASMHALAAEVRGNGAAA
jgi:hypothetical protein